MGDKFNMSMVPNTPNPMSPMDNTLNFTPGLPIGQQLTESQMIKKNESG